MNYQEVYDTCKLLTNLNYNHLSAITEENNIENNKFLNCIDVLYTTTKKKLSQVNPKEIMKLDDKIKIIFCFRCCYNKTLKQSLELYNEMNQV